MNIHTRILFQAVLLLALQPARLARAEDVSPGERLYRVHCASCHGPKGEGGRGSILAKGNLARVTDHASLIQVITQGIPGTEMVPARLNETEIRQVAAWVRKLGQSSTTAGAGNPSRGEQLYLAKGNCTQCHTIRAQGGVLGPDLTDVGARRSTDQLRLAVLDPEAEVADNFIQYRWYTVIPDNFLQVRLVTKDGKTIKGARLNEDPFSIQIRDLTGVVRSFFKADLAELHKDWGKSAMPSFRGTLSDQEIEDLVAYLASLRETRGGR